MMYRFLLACTLALFLGSCLDSKEEIWLNADGSGAALITMQMPANIAKLHGGSSGIESTLIKYFESNPTYTGYTVETFVEKERLEVKLAFTFDNALDLVDATTPGSLEELPPGAKNFMGEATIDFEGLDLVFNRRIELSKAIPGSIFFPSDRLQGHSVTTILHLPKPAKTHNATSTENNGKTLIWITPLADAFNRPVENIFTMPLPIPWLTLSVSGALVLLLIVTLCYYFLRKRLKRAVT